MIIIRLLTIVGIILISFIIYNIIKHKNIKYIQYNIGKYYPIGTYLKYNKHKIVVVPYSNDNRCNNCIFHKNNICVKSNCMSSKRKDDTCVIFKEIK